MNFSQDIPNYQYIISGYDESSVGVRHKRYTSSFAIHREGIIDSWPVYSSDTLSPEHFQEILQLKPELVILGTGNKLVFPPVEVRALFLGQGIGFEVMDTGAACRTYNILLSEDRHVVAALMVGVD